MECKQDMDILKTVMNKTGMKQIDLAKTFGVERSTISTSLRRTHMSVSTFAKYLNSMGYSLVVGTKADETFVPEWEVESGK